jgi:hypothetical protein
VSLFDENGQINKWGWGKRLQFRDDLFWFEIVISLLLSSSPRESVVARITQRKREAKFNRTSQAVAVKCCDSSLSWHTVMSLRSSC